MKSSILYYPFFFFKKDSLTLNSNIVIISLIILFSMSEATL